MAGSLLNLTGVIVGIYLVYITFRRALGEREDPNVSVAAESDTGSMTFLLSGSWYVVALVMLLAGLTWPAPVEYPAVGYLLALTVAVHAIIEWREAQ